MKRCPSCGESLPLSSFGRHAGRPDGLTAQCRDCHRASVYEWRDANPQKWRESKRRGRAKVAAAGGRPPVARKRCSGCGRTLAGSSFFRDKREASGLSCRCKECRAGWVRANLHLYVDAHHRRRASQVGGEKVDRRVVYERDGGRCHICRKPVDPANWHLEHLWPLSRGGSHSYDNVAVAHPTCNLSKHASTRPVQLRLGAGT